MARALRYKLKTLTNGGPISAKLVLRMARAARAPVEVILEGAGRLLGRVLTAEADWSRQAASDDAPSPAIGLPADLTAGSGSEHHPTMSGRRPFENIRRFAQPALARRARLEKAMNLQPGKIVEAMAAPRVLARFPHLKDAFRQGIVAESLMILIDLSPFSAVAASLEPAEIAGFLDEYYGHVVKAIESLDGVVEKYIGDAVLGLFGQPFLDRTSTQLLFNVIEMAKELISKAGGWFNGEVSAKVAIAFGSCFFGYVGPDEHKELTIIGNPLTTLFRLEAECDPNQIILLQDLMEQRPARLVRLVTVPGPGNWMPATKDVFLRGVSSELFTAATLTWRGSK